MKVRTPIRRQRLSNALRFIGRALRLLPLCVRENLWEIASILPSGLGAASRYVIAASLAQSIGANVFFGRFVEIKGWSHISFGSNVSVHSFSYLIGSGGICIGDNVAIAHGCSIVTENHLSSIVELPIKYNPLEFRPVTIDRDVWLGAGVKVLAGASICERVIVGAGAVVNKPILLSGVYVGVPVKIVAA